MQNHYNVLYREEEREMLPLCEQEGVGVIPWSPLARGVAARPHEEVEATTRGETDQYLEMMPYLQGGGEEINERLGELAEEMGVTMAQVALAWLLHQESVDGTLAVRLRPGVSRGALRAAAGRGPRVTPRSGAVFPPAADAPGASGVLTACSRVRTHARRRGRGRPGRARPQPVGASHSPPAPRRRGVARTSSAARRSNRTPESFRLRSK